MQTSERSEILSLLQNLRAEDFEAAARAVFEYQREHNPLYRQFLTLLGGDARRNAAASAPEFPFLPIQFFKTHKIVSNTDDVQEIFISSGTTNSGETSQHFVTDVLLYKQSYRQGFSTYYGNIEDYVVLALLPSYQERSGSSLIYMVDDLIKKTKNPNSGYYLKNHADLLVKIKQLQAENQNIILIGVTFALLDLVEIVKSKTLKFSYLPVHLM